MQVDHYELLSFSFLEILLILVDVDLWGLQVSDAPKTPSLRFFIIVQKGRERPNPCLKKTAEFVREAVIYVLADFVR